MDLKETAKIIIGKALSSAQPREAVARALAEEDLQERITLVAIGKAAWQMAEAAQNMLGEKIRQGIVITKYGHAMGELPGLEIWEAGHPVPDDNSYRATQAALDMVSELTEGDLVLFLVSGGGSALFEKPVISGEELADITRQLLASGADITKVNTIRKRLSQVKGGKFALACGKAQVLSIVLSDIIGDPLDMIASGPAYPDASTGAEALEIVKDYGLKLSPEAMAALTTPTPKTLPNVRTVVTGSVTQLCRSAADTCRELGIEPRVLTASISCTARDAGSFLASIAQYHQDTDHPVAYILGGETVVRLTGSGKGGRNQELALAAAEGLRDIPNAAVFSIGSDGTDGPTDAAGGYVDGTTCQTLLDRGIRIADVLRENDAYHALKQADGLIITGPTGTNVNDLTVLLLDIPGKCENFVDKP